MIMTLEQWISQLEYSSSRDSGNYSQLMEKMNGLRLKIYPTTKEKLNIQERLKDYLNYLAWAYEVSDLERKNAFYYSKRYLLSVLKEIRDYWI